MRSAGLVLVLGLAACAARAHGPAWPKMAEREVDGGESLAPRQASVVADATPAAADAKPEVSDDATPEAKPADATEDAEPTLGEPVIAPEEVINIDDIVIEIDDDD
jgi:hypothetical protein